MATTTGPQYSIYLELNGRTLTEGATLQRQTGHIYDTPAEAWRELAHGSGTCRLRCLPGNLDGVRKLWEQWADEMAREVVE